MKIDRAEFRRAIADEVATLRAINTALRGPLSTPDADYLNAVRASSVAMLRSHLGVLYRTTPRKPAARAALRIAEGGDR